MNFHALIRPCDALSDDCAPLILACDALSRDVHPRDDACGTRGYGFG